mmetsp:Transcript_16759/g.67621  ORF Transcript_16759/g.67621 Transcript_16759/m.67621 type:complete len:82 (-) Transcript_16759:2146-2391(-)
MPASTYCARVTAELHDTAHVYSTRVLLWSPELGREFFDLRCLPRAANLATRDHEFTGRTSTIQSGNTHKEPQARVARVDDG